MPIPSCGQSVSAQRGKRYTETGLLRCCVSYVTVLGELGMSEAGAATPPLLHLNLTRFCFFFNHYITHFITLNCLRRAEEECKPLVGGGGDCVHAAVRPVRRRGAARPHEPRRG